MATETPKKRTCSYGLANGTSASGATRVTLQSIGNLDKSAWDADKAMAIIGALSPITSVSIVSAQTVLTSDLRS